MVLPLEIEIYNKAIVLSESGEMEAFDKDICPKIIQDFLNSTWVAAS